MVYDIFYYLPDGVRCNFFDAEVGDRQLRETLESPAIRSNEYCQVINKNWPGPEGTSWYDPQGNPIEYEGLPWVKRERERQERAAQDARQRRMAEDLAKEKALKKGLQLKIREHLFVDLKIHEDNCGYSVPNGPFTTDTLIDVSMTTWNRERGLKTSTEVVSVEDLNQAAADWADLPESPEGEIYSAIVAALPQAPPPNHLVTLTIER